ncbi:unnamed protein product [Paramecium octaurelia]|uniref:Uncharacterized protein n=1 Tax=Paramecium octaurelia TaxID=43137 RepID=A0A8S1X2D5_PAROT|nr:unnamed protein product [Paramecium octaurelia]
MLQQYQPLSQLMAQRINKRLSFENQLKKFYKFLKIRDCQSDDMVLLVHFPGESVYIAKSIDNSGYKLNIDQSSNLIQAFLCMRISINWFVSLQKLKKIEMCPACQIECSLQLINAKHREIVITLSITENLVNSSNYARIFPSFQGRHLKLYMLQQNTNTVFPFDNLELIEQPENWELLAFYPLRIKSNREDTFNNVNLKSMVNS